MVETKIALAGLTVHVEHPFESFRDFAKEFVTTSADSDFSVSVSAADIEKERLRVEQQAAREGTNIGTVTPEMLEKTAVYRKIAEVLPRYNALIFHGSAIAVGNRAVIFSAPSGTGKTTHTRLWLNHVAGSFVINGDKPILRVIDGTVTVCGTPWNGKEHMGTNTMVPLTAICRLYRDSENHIHPVNPAAFLPHLLEQTYHPEREDALQELLPTVETVAQTTAFYALYCNRDPAAATLAFETVLA